MSFSNLVFCFRVTLLTSSSQKMLVRQASISSGSKNGYGKYLRLEGKKRPEVV